ncbi:hypothetical protein GCM10023238_16470 [Streptomyces heliomycini]
MRPSRVWEQLDREVADDAEFLGDVQRHLLGLQREVLGEAGAGAITVSQTPFTLPRLDDGVGDGLSVRERTTLAASSRTKSTFSIARRRHPP